MDAFLNGWGLTLVTFVPLVGAALVMALPAGRELWVKAAALGASLVTALFAVFLLARFSVSRAGELQYVVDRSWIDVINSRYIMGIDGISLPLLLLTALIVPLCIVYSFGHFPEPRNPKAFLSLLLVLETGMIGTFVAQDLILFFVFFEVVLLPMYFMIGVWGGENRRYAAIKFFLYTLFGSALMLVSFLAMFFLADGTLAGLDVARTFDMRALSGGATSAIARTSQLWIFAGMFLGFGIKVPMFPFHTWLPDAHTEAPTVGSVILAAVLLKLGTYGFVRVAVPMLPEAAAAWAPVIGLLAVIGIIYGALGCLAQRDMKRLIAFSSVAHMGFVMLGIATLTPFGINAAVFGMVAHGLITGMLFFLAGSVKDRYHTMEMSRLGGLLQQAPKMGWILGFCVMASLGLPGLAGFWGEFPAIPGVLQPRGDTERGGVPRLHGDRRHRHGAGGRLPAVDAAEDRLRQRPRGVRRLARRHRRHAAGVPGLGAAAGADRGAGVLPPAAARGHRPRGAGVAGGRGGERLPRRLPGGGAGRGVLRAAAPRR